MRRLRSLTLLAFGVAASSCSGTVKMGGFSERDARAGAASVEMLESCRVRSGKLVIEVERARVNEYPHYGADPERRREQPMLLALLEPPGTPADPRKLELSVAMAPAAYKPGEELTVFKGRRIFERTLRSLQGRRLTLKLGENDRTQSPAWADVTSKATAASGAVAVVGLPNPTSILNEIVGVLSKLDRDDLILSWSLDLDDLTRQLGDLSDRRLLRLSVQSTRKVSVGTGAGLPAAELAVLAYLEPEPGCEAAARLTTGGQLQEGSRQE